MEELRTLKSNKGIKRPKKYSENYVKIKKNVFTKFILNILIISAIFILLLTIIVLIIKYFIQKSYNFEIKEDPYTPYIPKRKNDSNFSKYESMLPHLSTNLNITPSSLEQIFNARELYISDVRITRNYIRYIRFINETEEEKYKKPYSESETIIDNNIFRKRPDQYNYLDFCKLALEEKLIDNNSTIEYDNKPIISIIVPSYNKESTLLKSIRSIQNQNFKNIEIIIVNDCSTDNSSIVFDYLLKTDPRIRIFHHIKNLGLFRSRLDGILYSRGKYIITFDTGDIYEDNYVLLDAYRIIKIYNLDSCKFLFRVIYNFDTLNSSFVYFHAGSKSKIVYGPKNIKFLNTKVFQLWGNIWNRLIRANICIKALLLLKKLMLNAYKNMWDDVWYNEIIHKASYSYAIFERVGYVYLSSPEGAGTPKFSDEKQKSDIIREFIGFLYFDYNFCKNKKCKNEIINKLKYYDKTDKQKQIKNFRNHFEVLNNLLKALIKDPQLDKKNKKYCKKLLKESKIREKKLIKDK